MTGMRLPSRSDDDERFHKFVARSTEPLTRLAYLLCGDQHLADDPVQTSMIRLYQAWHRVRQDSVDAYARKVLLRCWLNERRRPWRRSETRDGLVPDIPATDADPALLVGSDDIEVLRAALARVPPRQRAAVILRYWSEYSVTETAAILRCSEGNVKSQTARGIAALRAAMSPPQANAKEHHT